MTATSTDAINGSQLFATNQAIAAATTHYYSVNDGGTHGGNYVNDGATGVNAMAAGVGASAVGASSVALGSGAMANNGNDVALGAGSITAAANPTSSATITTASGAQITLTGFAGANPTSVVSVGTPGAERQITNVAAGRVTATSTDGVNGSQLYAVASTVDNAVNGGGIKYFHANSTAADSNAVGIDSIAVGPTATANDDSSVAQGSGAVAGVSGNPAVSGDVALGSGAQATGGKSLALGNGASVATLGGVALGAGSVADRVAGSYVDPISGYSFTTLFGAVSVGASGALRQITNVAPGTQLTDAVNLGQLQSAISSLNLVINNLPTPPIGPSTGGNQTWITGNSTTYAPPVASGLNATAGGSGSVASGSGSTALGDHATASGANSVALGANSVATAPNTVSVGSVGNERTISNVAPGVNGNDAVNVNQLNSGVSNAVTQSNQYTNQQIDGLKRDMNSGVAAAMAVAGLPQPTAPGKSMVAIAGSTWQGQQGIALGVSTISENGKWVYKGSLTTSSLGGTGAVLGAGYQW
ncbi:hypothetical protein WL32_06805 [Burkholderia cepacia]|nr:hypothetical protein WL32_06805 [Burkholderia cepacia]